MHWEWGGVHGEWDGVQGQGVWLTVFQWSPCVMQRGI